MSYYTPPEITVYLNRALAIGGFTRPNTGGVIVYVNGEERQYRVVHCNWIEGRWIIATATYGTRTKAKKWSIRDSWHNTHPHFNSGPVPPEVCNAGLQAILNQIKKEASLLKTMQASIEGEMQTSSVEDGPPRVPGSELEEN